MFRSDTIVFLIGAGCSAEAGISVSSRMRQDLEELLRTSRNWQQYSDLYNYVKGTIIQHDCSKGKGCSEPDIERLVITLTELERHQDSLLFPFIGSWSPRLQQITKHEFAIVERFRQEIVDQLKAWVMPRNYIRDSAYYSGFFNLADEWNYPVRVFSLNYDLCIEKHSPGDKGVMRGFDSSTRTWNSSLFEPRTEEDAVRIYLYKMHGSIDWERDAADGRLREADYCENPDLIFGIESKMQSSDPYLFYAYEFRRYCREAKVIIAIGYSFRDKHITDIIQQALQQEETRKLLVVSSNPDDCLNFISGQRSQVVPHKETAKPFLENLSLGRIMELTGIKEDDLLSTPWFRSGEEEGETEAEAETSAAVPTASA
jgi:hypothetical protein